MQTLLMDFETENIVLEEGIEKFFRRKNNDPSNES
jgi:hypothetical protein